MKKILIDEVQFFCSVYLNCYNMLEMIENNEHKEAIQEFEIYEDIYINYCNPDSIRSTYRQLQAEQKIEMLSALLTIRKLQARNDLKLASNRF